MYQRKTKDEWQLWSMKSKTWKYEFSEQDNKLFRKRVKAFANEHPELALRVKKVRTKI